MGRRFVGVDIGVAPDHVRGMAARRFVLGQIVAQHADRAKAVGDLKPQRRVAHFARNYLFDIIFRSIDLGQRAAEIGHARAEHDALQVQPFDEHAARIVKPLADAQPPLLRRDDHFIAVEPVAGRIVAAAKAVAGDRFPVVRGERDLFVDAAGGTIADHFAFIERDEHPFGIIVDMAADHPRGVVFDIAIGFAGQRQDAGNIAGCGVADFELCGGATGHRCSIKRAGR